MSIHFLIRLEMSPGKPDRYYAPCGYDSTNAKEFTRADKPSIEKVTCVVCLRKVHKTMHGSGMISPLDSGQVIKQHVAVES